MIALDILFNRALEAWEVVHKAREALMAYDVLVPLVEVLQHPWACIGPAIGVSADIVVHYMDMHESCCQPAKSKKKNLLRVDLVAAGMAVLLVPSWEGKLVLLWLKLALKIKGSVQTMQLTPVEVGHLQSSSIG